MSIPEHECLAIISQAEARSELQRIGVEIGIDDDRSASQFVVEALMYWRACAAAERDDSVRSRSLVTGDHTKDHVPYFA